MSKINPASDLIGAQAVCYEHRTEVLELVNNLQRLTIKQDGLALHTRDEYLHYLGFRGINAHADCCGMVVNCFKQALHLPVAVPALVWACQRRRTSQIHDE